ncbi:MAG: IS66 family insertion sequence element accessory protein TnpB [Geminicoccaceae bacterium]
MHYVTRSTSRIKVLVWDQTGIVLIHKRLEGVKCRLAQGSGRCDDDVPGCRSDAPKIRHDGPDLRRDAAAGGDVSCAVLGTVRRARLASCSSRSYAAAGTGGLAAAE